MERLVVLSYESGMPGYSPSEWLEDRLRVLRSMNVSTTLITNGGSSLKDEPGSTVIKVRSSLSLLDWKAESSRQVVERKESFQKKIQLRHALLPYSLGRVVDLFLRIFGASGNVSRYPWVIPAFFAAVRHFSPFRARAQFDGIYSTGGPTASHVAGIMVAAWFKKPIVIELQDPIYGADLRLSKASKFLLLKVERAIIRKCTKLIMVSKEAMLGLTSRHPEFSHKVVVSYPGAWHFLETTRIQSQPDPNVFEILHLGTLYETRDLNNLFAAIERIMTNLSFIKLKNRIRVTNLGKDFSQHGLAMQRQSTMYCQIDPLPRIEALARARNSDVLLLLQHTSTFSKGNETIPYKFYDYLNLGLPILGIVSNPELKSMLVDMGHEVADPDDVDSIAYAINKLLIAEKKEYDAADPNFAIDAFGHVAKMLSFLQIQVKG